MKVTILTLLPLLTVDFLSLECNAGIIEPNQSTYQACPGEILSIVCKVHTNMLQWLLQYNGITYKANPYFASIAHQHLINHSQPLTPLQRVSTTLLDYSHSPGYVKSSLQINISVNFAEATVICDSVVDRDEILITGCAQRIAFNVSLQYNNVNLFCLSWSNNNNYNNTIDINYSTLNKTTNLSTNGINVAIALSYNVDYTLSITTQCCSRPKYLGVFNTSISKCEADRSQTLSDYNNTSSLYLECKDNISRSSLCQHNVTLMDSNESYCESISATIESYHMILINSSNGSVVTYKCKDGYTPPGIIFSYCTDGKWRPHPSEQVCVKLQSYSYSTTLKMNTIPVNHASNYIIYYGVPISAVPIVLCFLWVILVVAYKQTAKSRSRNSTNAIKNNVQCMNKEPIYDECQMTEIEDLTVAKNSAYGVCSGPPVPHT